MKVRTRFAPSPTGYLHIGGLRTALYGWLYAKKYGGDFILRIEDTDTARYVDGSVEIIYDTLRDAGILYDEGPDVGGNYGPYVQSQRKEIYREYAEKLVELGGAYYCFCDAARLETLRDENGNLRYDKHCAALSKEEVARKIAAGEPYVIRQNVPEHGTGTYHDLVYGDISVDYKEIEDGILLKSDGMPTYNFANVVDDHLMGITHVIRGTEYLSSTPKYNLMYDAFGWERPVYIHLPPHHEGRAAQALQAERRRQLCGLRGKRVREGVHRQLHRPARLEPQGQHREDDARGAQRAFFSGGDRQIARHLRRGEDALAVRRIHERADGRGIRRAGGRIFKTLQNIREIRPEKKLRRC